MPIGKGEEMEQTPQRKTRGRPHREGSHKEARDCHPLLPPATEAEDPTSQDRQHLDLPRSQIPAAVEHPGTPAPWLRSRVRSTRLSQDPAGVNGKASSFSAPTIWYEETEASIAVEGGEGGGGDHQNWQAESIMQAKKRAKSLYQEQPDRAQAADVLENVLGHFLTYLQECPDRPYFRNAKELAPGSTYQYEKFLHPGEFEVLLSIPISDYIQYLEVEGYGGLFYTLTLLRKSRSFPGAFLLEDGKTISPRNIMEEFWKHVDQFVKVFYSVPFPGWQLRLEKKKPNCPAVSLVMLDNQGAKFMAVSLIPALEMVGQWPCMKKAKELLQEKELLHLTRVFHFIAKQSPGRHNKETWSISFSHVEKEILNRHSSPQACHRYHKTECCRKNCLKMLEDLVGALRTEYPQMVAPLSSYHTRTSFLHTLWEYKADGAWKPSELAQCFERVLANFIHEVATAHLTHVFLPKCNLFGAKFFPPTKLKFLWARLTEKGGRAKTFTVSRKKGCSVLMLNPDMRWPLTITLGLLVLVLAVLPHVAL